MTGKLKNISITMALMLFSLATISCGGEDTRVFAVDGAGNEISLPVENIDIVAGGLGGTALAPDFGPTFTGGELRILISMLNRAGGFQTLDTIEMYFPDIASIFPYESYSFGGGIAQVAVTLQGIPQQFVAGVVQFEQLSNRDGGNVRGIARIQTGSTELTVDFSDNLRFAY